MEIRIAKLEDAEEIMRVVNSAYECEKGSSGTKFTKGPRLEHATEGKLEKAYTEGRILKAVDTVTQSIIGMAYWELTECNTLYFGPFAVKPEYQGRKVGKRLLAELERIARREGVEGLDIQVVNVRTDMVSWYESLGYKEIEKKPFPSESMHLITRPVHFLVLRRIFSGDENIDEDYSAFSIQTASVHDADEIMIVVNEAYDCEKDSTEFSFKKERRLVTPMEGKLEKAYTEGRILKAVDTVTQSIIGMAYWELTECNTLYFGPFAVKPEYQGRKVGKRLLAELERIARREGVEGLDIQVVNVRTDMVSWYESLGFECAGCSPYPPASEYKLTRPVHFVNMRRHIRGNITGGCYCGKIRYNISSHPTQIYYCHCTICRRISGSVVMAWLTIETDNFSFIECDKKTLKPEGLATFQTSENFKRCFCGCCGSHILFKRIGTESKYLEVCHGSLDDADQFAPKNHIWTKNQLGFLHLHDELPKYLTEP